MKREIIIFVLEYWGAFVFVLTYIIAGLYYVIFKPLDLSLVEWLNFVNTSLILMILLTHVSKNKLKNFLEEKEEDETSSKIP